MFRRARITTTAVEKLAAGDTIMDVGLAGYGVRRQGEARIFFVRKHFDGRRHFVAIGEHGREGWTEARARAQALVILAAIKQGADPTGDRAKARAMPTLAEFAGTLSRLRLGSNPARSRTIAACSRRTSRPAMRTAPFEPAASAAFALTG